MIPASYRRQDGCHNCDHALRPFDADNENSCVLACGLSAKPPIHLILDYPRVDADGVCDNWKKSPP